MYTLRLQRSMWGKKKWLFDKWRRLMICNMEIGRGAAQTIGLYDSTVSFRNFISNGFFSAWNKDTYSICNSEGYACPKGTMYQDVFIYIKFHTSISILDYIYQDLHTRKTRFHLFYVYGNFDMYNLDINKYILIYCPFWTVVSSILPNFRVLSFFFLS